MLSRADPVGVDATGASVLRGYLVSQLLREQPIRFRVTRSPFIAVACAAVYLSSGTQAQPQDQLTATSILTGVVVDTVGVPVAFAEVFLVETEYGTFADDEGRFRLENLQPAKTRIGVRRIGFAPVYFDLEMPVAATVDLKVRMRQNIQRLSTVEVRDDIHHTLRKEGFYERMAAGNGLFVTPEMIAAMRPYRATDALSNIPNVVVERRGTRTRILGANQRCEYGLVVDRIRVGMPGSRVRTTTPDDAVSGTDIYAIEVYPRNRGAPAQFVGLSNEDACGTIVIWTKWVLRR